MNFNCSQPVLFLLYVVKFFAIFLFMGLNNGFLFSFVKLIICAVVGSPVEFKVIDLDKVVVRGDGLGLVPNNRPATFTITAPDAKLSDIDVAITSEFGQHLYLTYSYVLRSSYHCLMFISTSNLILVRTNNIFHKHHLSHFCSCFVGNSLSFTSTQQAFL